ncbi:MAG: rRNA maturation RNase YbeY [Eubacteriales bacterium]|nr:rRNA maturation RNase YbeY [Eubacteriales bacterium]
MVAITKRKGRVTREERKFVENAVNAALDQNGFTRAVLVNILFTDDEEICRLNREFRQIDKPTDVLSFPYLEYTFENGKPAAQYGSGDYDCRTGKLLLGDIVISAETAARQAEEYGHSLRREIGYLIVHAMLHLLGYDHIEEADRVLMRSYEEKILERLNLARPDSNFLLEKAQTAAQNAYCVYSGIHVGAAVLADGKIYLGCNVENASYGATICAERTAICAAITAGEKSFEAIAVSRDDGKGIAPCGICRQFILQFGDPLVVFRDEEGRIVEKKASELLPTAFSLKGKEEDE